MKMIAAIRADFLALPGLVKFALVMAAIAGAPALAEIIGIPSQIVLLLFGMLTGPHVIGLWGAAHPVAQFFGDLGELLIMFGAGLEIDLALFRAARMRSLSFGLVTTLLPLGLGALFASKLGYAVIPAVTIGTLLASHTLLSMPILSRLGAIRLEPVVVCIGATVVSDTLSLIAFAICVSMYQTGFSPGTLTFQIAEVMIFVPLILVGVSRAGTWVLRKIHDNEEAYFVVMLGIMAVSGVMAHMINLPGIVGAFLAGLSVNAAVKDHPAKRKMEFIGNALFIPAFFIVTGFLISPVTFFVSLYQNFVFVVAIVGALLLAKGAAAALATLVFRYKIPSGLTMWAVTLPQVAATLAATLVGRDTLNAAGIPLLDDKVLNTVFVLLVVTSILGPMLTDVFAPRMVAGQRRQLAEIG